MPAENEPPIPDELMPEIVQQLTQLTHNNEQLSAEAREWYEKRVVRAERNGRTVIIISEDVENLWKLILKVEDSNKSSVHPMSLTEMRLARLARLKLSEITEAYYRERVERTQEAKAKGDNDNQGEGQ